MTPVRPEIAAMAGYVPGEQPQGGKFIKLNTNENPYPPSPAVGRAIEQACRDGLARYPDPLATAFRIRAGELLDVDPGSILCGNGSDDILTIVTRAFVPAGGRVRFAQPSYVLYGTLAGIQGAEAETVRFANDWTLDAKFATQMPAPNLVYLPNPNSPSGTVIAPERIAELADHLPCPLLIDEAYVDFAETDCLHLVAENERIMVSRTLSKSYALAGLRFGFLVAQPQVITELRKVKDSYNCDALSIAGATAAFDDQAWLGTNRARICATRTRMAARLGDLGFTPPKSEANFVWCPHPTVSTADLYEQLKRAGILVRYMNYVGWGDGLRISVGTDDQTDAALAALKAIV